MAKKTITENTEKLDEVKSSAGNGAEVADAVTKGDTHANRRADAPKNAEPMPTIDGKNGPSGKAELISWSLKNMGNADVFAAFQKIKSEWDAKRVTTSAGTTAAKSIVTKEDVDSLFGNEALSEDFKDKASVLFEAAVGAKVAELEAKLEEEYSAKVEEITESLKAEMTDKLDGYLDYVAEQWIAENELAIETGLRVEVAESFLSGLKNLFETHYVDLPEGKVDVVESLAGEVEALTAKLDEQIAANISMKQKLDEAAKAEVLSKLSEGLTLTQKEKLQSLVEGVETADIADFTKKAELIKESHFSSKTVLTEDTLSGGEAILTEQTAKPVSTDPEIAAIAAAISRTKLR